MAKAKENGQLIVCESIEAIPQVVDGALKVAAQADHTSRLEDVCQLLANEPQQLPK